MRKNSCVWDRVRERYREWKSVCVRVFMCERECVCVCVCVRERERLCVCKREERYERVGGVEIEHLSNVAASD